MLGIVVVVYKSFNETVNFIKNEISKISIPYKLIIVNNGASIEESRELANYCNAILVNELWQIDKNDNLFVISADNNLGYARGNNLGANFLDNNFDIDYLLFSNNDIEIIDKTVVNKLINFLKKNKEIALVGPTIKEPDGSIYGGHKKHVTIYRRIGWNLLSFLRKKNKYVKKQKNSAIPSECIWVSGCFFVIKNEVFKKVEGFDEGTFLYGEEIILSERIKRIGNKTYFYPDATILHVHSQTIGKALNNSKIRELNMNSAIYYYKNYKKTANIILWLYKISFRFNEHKYK